MHSDDRVSLLSRAKGGDQEALGRLLESYRPYMHALVRALRGPVPLGAEADSDLVQEAMVQLTRGITGFRGAGVPEWGGWLRQVVIRTAGHALARRRPEGRFVELSALPVLPDAVAPVAGDQAERHDEALKVARLLGRLPAEMQQVVTMRVVDGLDHQEIARRLGKGHGAVRMIYLRGLRKLRELCGQEEGQP